MVEGALHQRQGRERRAVRERLDGAPPADRRGRDGAGSAKRGHHAVLHAGATRGWHVLRGGEQGNARAEQALAGARLHRRARGGRAARRGIGGARAHHHRGAHPPAAVPAGHLLRHQPGRPLHRQADRDVGQGQRRYRVVLTRDALGGARVRRQGRHAHGAQEHTAAVARLRRRLHQELRAALRVGRRPAEADTRRARDVDRRQPQHVRVRDHAGWRRHRALLQAAAVDGGGRLLVRALRRVVVRGEHARGAPADGLPRLPARERRPALVRQRLGRQDVGQRGGDAARRLGRPARPQPAGRAVRGLHRRQARADECQRQQLHDQADR